MPVTFTTPAVLNSNYLPAKMNAVALNSSDVYIAVGDNGKFMISADGTSWGTPLQMSTSTSSSYVNMNAVIANGTTFIAVGTDSDRGYAVYAKYDTVTSTWTTPATMSGTPTVATMTSVTYSNSVYVAVGYDASNAAIVSTSSNGSTWSVPSNINSYGSYSRLHSITANSAGLFIAVGTDGANSIYVKYDSAVTSPVFDYPELINGNDSIPLNSITVSLTGTFMAVGVGSNGFGISYTTQNGVTWSTATAINTTAVTFTSVAVDNSDVFVAIGYNSSNLPFFAYTTQSSLGSWNGPEQMNSSGSGATGIMKSIIKDSTGTGFVAIGYNTSNYPVYSRSAIGNSWNDPVLMISSTSINSMTVSPLGKIIGLGQFKGSKIAISISSTDGYTWTTPVFMGDAPTEAKMTSVAVNSSGICIAVGYDKDYYPLYSKANSTQSGVISWGPIQQINNAYGRMTSVAVNSAGLFMAIGVDSLNNAIYFTYDSSQQSPTWTSPITMTSPYGAIMSSITVNSSGVFVAVGNKSNGYPLYAIWNTSQLTWNVSSLANYNSYALMKSVTVNSSGVFVAVGNDSDGYPIYSRSTNGSSWSTPAIMNGYTTEVTINSVTVSSQGTFVAVGSDRNAYPMYSSSSDGSNWTTPVTIAGYTEITDLTSVVVKSSGLFVAVGENNLGFPMYTTATARPPCFLEGTTILCQVNGKEAYLPIENVKPGMLVKTSLNGFKKVKLIGKRLLENPGTDERIQDRLYKCSVKNYPELDEDLYITGCHSILVDTLTEKQREDTMKSLKDIFVTDQKYRLIAFLDERAEPWNSEGEHMVWHLALEHENVVMNYGVYVNGGLLVETASIKCMVERAKMELQ